MELVQEIYVTYLETDDIFIVIDLQVINLGIWNKYKMYSDISN